MTSKKLEKSRARRREKYNNLTKEELVNALLAAVEQHDRLKKIKKRSWLKIKRLKSEVDALLRKNRKSERHYYETKLLETEVTRLRGQREALRKQVNEALH